MTRKDDVVDRRKFLASAAIAGAGTAIPSVLARAQTAVQPPTAAFVRRPSTAAAEAEMAGPVDASPGTLGGPPGSDFMVDVLKSLEFDYLFSDPAQSCRGIHESFVNYGGNKKPEFITCMHVESAVAMTHGYFKVAANRPLVCARPRVIPKLNLLSSLPGDRAVVRWHRSRRLVYSTGNLARDPARFDR
jgi:hypothetical protein